MTMIDRALDLLRSDPAKTYSLAELAKFAGIKPRSRGRLALELINHPEAAAVDVNGSRRWRYQPDLSIGMDIELKKLGF